jgi:8-oxo-dGTP pyrophosphatase MutT (NUDIX family)
MTSTVEERLRQRGDWLGASCVPRWADQGFLLAGEVRRGMLMLSGIGGKVEPGETFEAAMRREFGEETGCAAGPAYVPPQPRWLTPEARAEPVPAGAAALVAARPPAHPLGGILWIAVFVTLAGETPRPVEKVTTFVVVPPAAMSRPPGALSGQDLAVIRDGAAVPVPLALPRVTEIGLKDTAAAILSAPGLLAQWWAATAAREEAR